MNVVMNPAQWWRVLDCKQIINDLSSEDKMLAKVCIHSLHRTSHFLERRLWIKSPTDPASALRLPEEGCMSGVSAGGSGRSRTADTPPSLANLPDGLCAFL